MASDRNPLDLLDRDFVAVRSYSLVVRGLSCAAIAYAFFERAASFQIDVDRDCPQGVAVRPFNPPRDPDAPASSKWTLPLSNNIGRRQRG